MIARDHEYLNMLAGLNYCMLQNLVFQFRFNVSIYVSGCVVVDIVLESASALGDSEIKYGRLMVACLPELSSNSCQGRKSQGLFIWKT